MEEKTSQLRDIFMDVADEATVTEEQQETPGTLTGDTPIDDRLDSLIAQMQDRYAFHSDLSPETYRAIARAVYDEQDDGQIATSLDVDEDTVFAARLDLHLLTAADRDGPIPIDTVRKHILQDDTDDIAAQFDTDPEILDRTIAVAETDIAMRQANYRFRDALDDILGDGDVAEHFTDDVTDDGLRDATEGMEIETSF